MDLTFKFPEKGNAARHVTALPNEMIKYELESQDIKCHQNPFCRKKQLSDILESREFRPGKYYVAIGYKDDLAACVGHLNNWIDMYEKTNKSKVPVDLFAARLRHLFARVNRIAIIDGDESEKTTLSQLKWCIVEFRNRICHELNLGNPNSQSSIPQNSNAVSESNNLMPNSRIENWSVSERSPVVGNSRNASLHSSFNQPTRPNDSILDFSLEMQNDINKTVPSKRVPQVASTFYSNPQASRFPTAGLTFLQSYPGQTSYLPPKKPELWKWNLKFTGDKGSLHVSEFIRRVDELAVARGATKEDLFNGAVDLFDGTAIKWLRAGKLSNFFVDWDHIVEQLSLDFQDMEYGDTLWDFIRNRQQKPDESIVAYFAEMEDLFLRLNRPVSELVKAMTLRRNLRPELIQGLGVTEHFDVYSLKKDCRMLESNFRRINSRNL